TPIPQALAPKYVPSNFTAPVAPAAQTWPSPDWWKGFGSDELNGYIATAQTENMDLAAATARVLQAEAQSEIAGSALFPALDLQGTAERQRTGTGGVILGQGGQITGTKSSTTNAFGLLLNATYELDI